MVPLRSRRWTGRRVLVGGALIALVIGVGIFLSPSDDTGEVLTTATLAYYPGSSNSLDSAASGGTSLISHDDKLTVEIVDSRLPDPGEGADLEVWLIQPDAEGNAVDLVSLGVVNPDEPGLLDIPSSHDPAVH